MLHKADEFLCSHTFQLVSHKDSDKSLWKWLLLADKCSLQVSMKAIARRLPHNDLQGCKDVQNMEELSPAALKRLVAACAKRASYWKAEAADIDGFIECLASP